jgi:predicted nucleic acid-binding protein
MPPVRAVLDANVLISAAIRPSGPPGQILRALFAHQTFEPVLSPTTIADVEKAYRSKKIRRYLREAAQAMLFLADAGDRTIPAGPRVSVEIQMTTPCSPQLWKAAPVSS